MKVHIAKCCHHRPFPTAHAVPWQAPTTVLLRTTVRFCQEGCKSSIHVPAPTIKLNSKPLVRIFQHCTGCPKKIEPFFYFFSRCPVCGEWCKLHWLNFRKRYNLFRTPCIFRHVHKVRVGNCYLRYVSVRPYGTTRLPVNGFSLRFKVGFIVMSVQYDKYLL